MAYLPDLLFSKFGQRLSHNIILARSCSVVGGPLMVTRVPSFCFVNVYVCQIHGTVGVQYGMATSTVVSGVAVQRCFCAAYNIVLSPTCLWRMSTALFVFRRSLDFVKRWLIALGGSKRECIGKSYYAVRRRLWYLPLFGRRCGCESLISGITGIPDCAWRSAKCRPDRVLKPCQAVCDSANLSSGCIFMLVVPPTFCSRWYDAFARRSFRFLCLVVPIFVRTPKPLQL